MKLWSFGNENYPITKRENELNQMDIVNQLGFLRESMQRTMKKLIENDIIERKGGKRFDFWEIHN